MFVVSFLMNRKHDLKLKMHIATTISIHVQERKKKLVYLSHHQPDEETVA